MGEEAEDIETVVEERDEGVATPGESSEETESNEDTLPQVTQQELDNAFIKQKSRLNKRNDATQQELQSASEALALAQEENKVLRLYADQLKAPVASPDVDDFDLGSDDPKFIQKKAEHDKRLMDDEIARQIAVRDKENASANAVHAESAALEAAQNSHFERAKGLNKADYSEKENAVIDIFGVDAFNGILRIFPDDSHRIAYYLGTNPAEAKRIHSLSKVNALAAVAEIGALLERHLKVKPKLGSVAPAPDEQIQGSATSKKQRGPLGATYS